MPTRLAQLQSHLMSVPEYSLGRYCYRRIDIAHYSVCFLLVNFQGPIYRDFATIRQTQFSERLRRVVFQIRECDLRRINQEYVSLRSTIRLLQTVRNQAQSETKIRTQDIDIRLRNHFSRISTRN